MKYTFSRAALTVLACFILLVSAPLVARQNSSVIDDINIEYEKFTLDNGLTVLVYPEHSVPTVFVGMWYGVGSKDEPPGKTGFAHLFEHLMFQGTENREGEYFTPFTEAGAVMMNGTTSQDRTNYFATVPTGALDMALWMESDRMINLLGAITEEAVDEQRDVVKNEKRQRGDRPFAQVNELVMEGLFPESHPYHHSIVGTMEDLTNARLEDVHGWFKDYYGASNAVLMLAGDISVETAKEKVAHYFSSAPAGKPLMKRQKWVPELSETRKDVLYDKVGNIRLTRSWTSPNIGDDDAVVMRLVAHTLGNHTNAPLKKTLVDELKLATAVDIHHRALVLSGVLTLQIDLSPGVEPEQVWSVVEKIMADYMSEGPDVEILNAYQLSSVPRQVSQMESKISLAMQLAEGQLYSDDPVVFKKNLRLINQADEADLKRVANKWLTRNYYELSVFPFPEYVVTESEVDRSAIPTVELNDNLNVPDTETATLDNGMKLVVVNNGSVPLVRIKFITDTGFSTTGNPADNGLAKVGWYLRDRGTKNYTRDELVTAMDAISMGPTLRAHRESSYLKYWILSPKLDESLELAAEIMMRPTYPEDEIAKARLLLESFLKTREESPVTRSNDYFNRAIWGKDHPSGAMWDEASVAAINRDRFVAWSESQVTPSNTTVYMVGDITMKQAKRAINKSFGKWKSNFKPEYIQNDTKPPARARVVLIDQPGASQTSIAAGQSMRPYDPATDTGMLVVNKVLGGGFVSRLVMNLREDKGWTYGIRSSFSHSPKEDTIMHIAGNFQTDKTAESMIEINKELREFVTDRPITAEELKLQVDSNSRMMSGVLDGSEMVLGNVVWSEMWGMPYDFIKGEARRMQELTLDGVNEMARSLIKPDLLTWVVIGDLAVIEDEIRALNYGEVEVWNDDGNRIR